MAEEIGGDIQKIPDDVLEDERIVTTTPEVSNQFFQESQDVIAQADKTVAILANDFSSLLNMSLVPEVARKNIANLITALGDAYKQCEQDGKVTIEIFGQFKTFTSPQQIRDILQLIQSDFVLGSNPQIESGERLQILDKYIFDTHKDEGLEYSPSVLVLEDDGAEKRYTYPKDQGGISEDRNPPDMHKITFMQQLRDENIVTDRKSPVSIDPRALTVRKLSQGVAEDDPRILIPEGERFDIVLVEAKNGLGFNQSADRLTQLRIDEWRLPPEQRPRIIIFTDGVKPELLEVSQFQPMTLVTTIDDLRTKLALDKETVAQMHGKTDIEPDIVAAMQESQYDNSFDLRKWEHMTAGTYQSLDQILKEFSKRETMRLWTLPPLPGSGDIEGSTVEYVHGRVRTVLDGGTGDGRIAGLLARLGYNVVGVDISEKQIERGKVRFQEEGEGLRGEREADDLAFPALLRLQDEGKLPGPIIKDDRAAFENYITIKGDFMHLFSRLESFARREWKEKVPQESIWNFFNVPQHLRNVGVSTFGYFANNIGFDAAMFNWHTFCELSKLSEQQYVARQVFDLLMPDGLLILEVPDRTVDPYASLVHEYHDAHPDERFGTRRDSYATEEGELAEFSPRYFPSRHEIVTLLQAAGFIIQPEKDIQTYLITSEEPDGQKKLNAKELFIVAHKPAAVSED